jgi:hypothetical protein
MTLGVAELPERFQPVSRGAKNSAPLEAHLEPNIAFARALIYRRN